MPHAEAIDLIARMLAYVPEERVTAIEICAHPFFDELRDPAVSDQGDNYIFSTTSVFSSNDQLSARR